LTAVGTDSVQARASIIKDSIYRFFIVVILVVVKTLILAIFIVFNDQKPAQKKRSPSFRVISILKFKNLSHEESWYRIKLLIFTIKKYHVKKL